MKKPKIRNKLFLGLVLLLVLPATLSLFRPGFFVSDDGDWMVIRLSDFHWSFVSGQIPVRWAARLNYGYGYPVFNFSYPLSFYFGETFHLFGFSFVDSIKLVFIFSFFLSALLMYFFARELWGKWGGLVAAVFYVFAPYRFLDVYVRGSLGEAVSFVFIPLIFWMFYKLSQKRSWLYVSIGALAYAGLIVSHNIMAMLATPVILAYFVFNVWLSKERKSLAIQYGLLLILSLSLSCFFWLPALNDKQFTVLSQFSVADFRENFPSLKQLFVPGNQPSFQLGLIHLLVVLFSLILVLKRRPRRSSTLFFLLIFFSALFLTSFLSLSIWQMITLLWWSQFPWRLLAITTFSSALLAGALVQMIKPKFKTIFAVALIVLVVLLNYKYAKPQSFVNRPESFYATNEATTTIKDEYMPIWVVDKPVQRAEEKVEFVTGQGLIKNLAFNSKKVSFEVQAEIDSEIQVNTIYFPGWQVKVNDSLAVIDYQNKQGLIQFKIPPGNHQVVVEFKETPLRLAADVISLLSLLVVSWLLIKKRKE